MSNLRKHPVILQSIKRTLQEVVPQGGSAYLFGSQARGDARSSSDWDILILVNKERISHDDFDKIAYPLIELGWEMETEINPLLYTYQDWEKRHFTPFYHEVNKDKIILWH